MSLETLTAADEGQHAVEDIAHWSESWYFDAVGEDGLGVYLRTGRQPGRSSAIFTASLVLPDGPTVLVVDPDAPLPDDDAQTIRTEAFVASQECVRVGQTFRLRLVGTGRLHEDHAAPLRAEPGTPVEVELDLVWETDATPYRWQLTTRYEVPCRVTGSVRVGDQRFSFAGPGQRDHSWGPRNWWGHEWMWSAFHLEDGTRTHAVVLADVPGMMIGYVQREGELVELTHGTSSATTPGPDGLFGGDVLVHGDADLELAVTTTGSGPLRLVSDEGRIAFFVRSMATATTPDGRRGTGWIEWNRVQR